MQTKLTEQQNFVREAREEAKQLRAKLALLPAARLAPAIADFRRSLQSFRGGLISCKEDVVGVLAAARQDLEVGVGRELVGFVKMVMPLALVDAPLAINTEKLSRQQLSTAVRHSLGKYREAEVRACQLNAALQDAKGFVRVMCRFAPPPSSLHAVSPTRGGGCDGERGQEEGDRQRGRAEERGTLVHFRGGGRMSVWEEGVAGGKEFLLDHVFQPTCSQGDFYQEHRALLNSVLEGQSVTVLGYGPRRGGKSYSLFGRSLRAEAEDRGMAVRFLEDAFMAAKRRSVLCNTYISLSIFEIRDERVRDLLIREGTGGGENGGGAGRGGGCGW